ncbi:uncharacterized protein LOC141667524 [Apium graveolens]|uniref:uncharacterized protein LOC141667524 n=1 Tax=Apium graveolens TaxID=4045 RepID=UPI003D79D798
MSTRVYVYIHHHGDLDITKPSYHGGKVDAVNLDTNEFSFHDLDDFSKEFDYDSSAIVYFKTNDHNFSDGIKILYDDDSVREVINVSMPYGKIDLYIDHSFDFAFPMNDTENKIFNGDLSDSENDPEYFSETESSESDCSSLVDSDEELNECRQSQKLFKEQLASDKFRDISSHESSFESDELRSIDFSSEDEISRKGFIGDNLIMDKRRKREKLFKAGHEKEAAIKFKIGMKFLSMDEFRSTLRQYGLNDRRAVYFVKNDSQRCQIICEQGCPIYIWCTRIKDSENVQIKTLVDNHCCTKPYTNKHAIVKYLTEKYGDRIRKDPQWKIKDMIEVIKKEMEIEVTRIKCIRVRKAALEGVYDSLKEHYARVRDFASEVLKVNSKNTIKISTTRMDMNS